jgi:catechol 2,3-dioxygenase-like lactoylglutathione lyase family enzyme
MIFMSHPVFPTPDIGATASYYRDVLGFRVAEHLDAVEPHVCLYRDGVEIILTKTTAKVRPNRELYGYGFDAYMITDRQAELQRELSGKGAIIARPLAKTDYHNSEFVVEDIDGRWLGFGLKEL